MRATTAFDYERENLHYPRLVCPACGERPDYCSGHGESGDPQGHRILLNHDHGEHEWCHPKSNCRPSDLATIRTRVERGAALLDEIRPGWAHLVDEGFLDMSSGCSCVVGQLQSMSNPDQGGLDAYMDGLRQFIEPLFERPENLSTHRLRDLIGVAHGFYTFRDADYKVLDEEWRLAIRERTDV